MSHLAPSALQRCYSPVFPFKPLPQPAARRAKTFTAISFYLRCQFQMLCTALVAPLIYNWVYGSSWWRVHVTVWAFLANTAGRTTRILQDSDESQTAFQLFLCFLSPGRTAGTGTCWRWRRYRWSRAGWAGSLPWVRTYWSTASHRARWSLLLESEPPPGSETQKKISSDWKTHTHTQAEGKTCWPSLLCSGNTWWCTESEVGPR